MARRNALSLTALCLAMSVSGLSAHAAPRLDLGKSALCASAMKIKRDESGHAPKDALVFSKATDWFTSKGREIDSVNFAKIAADHDKVLRKAQANGNSKFTQAVNGCRVYYETSSGDT